MLAERSDIQEEVVRLENHIKHFHSLLEQPVLQLGGHRLIDAIEEQIHVRRMVRAARGRRQTRRLGGFQSLQRELLERHQAQSVIRTLVINHGDSSPQDVKLSPDGRTLYTADQLAGGLWEINPSTFRVIGFLHTGAGAHGLYPSRNARTMYVSNRQAGTVSIVSFRTRRVIRTWQLPLPASPDMGGVSADGRTLLHMADQRMYEDKFRRRRSRSDRESSGKSPELAAAGR